MLGPLVSVIVVNYNGASVLADCVRSIIGQDYARVELWVVDNGSSDGSDRLPELAAANVRVLRLGSNLGFAEANNRAIADSTGELIALVNNDVVLESSWISAMVEALGRAPQAGAAAGRTLQAARPELIDAAGFMFFSCCSAYSYRDRRADAQPTSRKPPFGPVASAAMYRRTALDVAGCFEPEYFCYYEDTDLAVRLVLFGYDTVYVHAAIALHRGSFTVGAYSDFHVYHLRRNAEYLYWSDMVGPLALVHLPFHLLHEGSSFVAALSRGQAGAVLRAKRDALSRAGWILARRRALAQRLAAEGVTPSAARTRLTRRMQIGLPIWPRLFGRI
jgi:GT2 family glycosyltransferase